MKLGDSYDTALLNILFSNAQDIIEVPVPTLRNNVGTALVKRVVYEIDEKGSESDMRWRGRYELIKNNYWAQFEALPGRNVAWIDYLDYAWEQVMLGPSRGLLTLTCWYYSVIRGPQPSWLPREYSYHDFILSYFTIKSKLEEDRLVAELLNVSEEELGQRVIALQEENPYVFATSLLPKRELAKKKLRAKTFASEGARRGENFPELVKGWEGDYNAYCVMEYGASFYIREVKSLYGQGKLSDQEAVRLLRSARN